jgi:hypothetical protein
MRKIVKLKESDLMNIVKRVIKEQSLLGLESKLRSGGFKDAKNTGGKIVLVKKIQGSGSFFFEFTKTGVVLNIFKPSKGIIDNPQLKLKQICKKDNCNWYTTYDITEVDGEKMMNVINSLGQTSTQPMDEERMNFKDMSDEELHSLHPHIKKHPNHFKDFKPTSEYLGWRGEVDKRNIYKRGEKFHDAFDKKK